MTTSKQCRKCGATKPLTEFYKNASTKDGRHSYCKICAKQGAIASYQRLEKQDKRASLRAAKQRQKFVQRINDIKQDNTCCLCGENEPVCLDFHHLDSTKKEQSVSRMTRNKSPKVFDEIRKCAVICANCHRKVHAGLVKVYKKHLCKIKGSLVSM